MVLFQGTARFKFSSSGVTKSATVTILLDDKLPNLDRYKNFFFSTQTQFEESRKYEVNKLEKLNRSQIIEAKQG